LALFIITTGGGKRVKAKGGSITLLDEALESTGNVFSMPSSTSYQNNESIGTIVQNPKLEAIGYILLRSSKNRNIYHTMDIDFAKRFTNYVEKA
jgi:hypothetical protein